MLRLLAAALFSCGFLTTWSASAKGLSESDGYLERAFVLPEGTLRIDAAPSDYGYMDFGALNNLRGLRVWAQPGPEVVYMGLGAGLGIAKNWEVGLLALPVFMAPSGDFGNLDVYGRYQFFDGDFQLGAQLAMLIPTNEQFGVGIGLPALFPVGDSARIDSGIEIEMLTGPTRFSLNVPLAVAFGVGDQFFIGPRTGFRVDEFEDLVLPLGVFLGTTAGKVVDLSGAITFRRFLSTAPFDDAVNVDWVEVTFGATMFLDAF